jgi:hypothetical protein
MCSMLRLSTRSAGADGKDEALATNDHNDPLCLLRAGH